MSNPPKIELTFVPEDYWDIYVTALERDKLIRLRRVYTHLGILLILISLILGLLVQRIQTLFFEGGLEILMLILVFGAGYFVYEIWQNLNKIREMDIPQAKADTTNFIERNKNIESAFLSYDANSFFMEIDGEFLRHQWYNLISLRKAINFIAFKWENGSYIFSQSAMSEAEFEDLQSFLEDKFELSY